VDKMMEEGLVEEIRQLLAAGVPKTCTAMQAIGYKEMVAAVETGGDVAVAAEEVKLRSRQYAKRQLTWFRRNKDTHWIHWDAQPDFAAGRQSAAKFVEASGL
jgi:tRNA dimethylallyltransferase